MEVQTLLHLAQTIKGSFLDKKDQIKISSISNLGSPLMEMIVVCVRTSLGPSPRVMQFISTIPILDGSNMFRLNNHKGFSWISQKPLFNYLSYGPSMPQFPMQIKSHMDTYIVKNLVYLITHTIINNTRREMNNWLSGHHIFSSSMISIQSNNRSNVALKIGNSLQTYQIFSNANY